MCPSLRFVGVFACFGLTSNHSQAHTHVRCSSRQWPTRCEPNTEPNRTGITHPRYTPTNRGNHPTPTHTHALMTLTDRQRVFCLPLLVRCRLLRCVRFEFAFELVVQSRCSSDVSSFASRSAGRSCPPCCCLLAVGCCWLVFLGTSRHCKRRPFSV